MHEGPVPEVTGPNSYPTGSRFDTSTESYADGWPDTPVITESAKRARAKMTTAGSSSEEFVRPERTESIYGALSDRIMALGELPVTIAVDSEQSLTSSEIPVDHNLTPADIAATGARRARKAEESRMAAGRDAQYAATVRFRGVHGGGLRRARSV